MLLAAAALAQGAAAAEIRLATGPDRPHRVSVVGLSDDDRSALLRLDAAALGARLAVFTGPPDADLPAVAGFHRVDGEGLHFRPRFPFVPGLVYHVRAQLGGVTLEHRFEVPPADGAPPRVLAVFPSADVLPENLLRFYVHFSAPMEARDAHRHVRLVDDEGRELPLSFVEIEHGLWDPRQTRLTLLLHPGRIKRGVAPGEALGPPLRAGRAYRLVVDARMADTAGRALGQPFEKRFRAAGSDRQAPDRAGVRVEAPARPDRPLVVHLPEPLDEALLHRLLWVEDAQGQPVEGSIAIEAGETSWSFTPVQPWAGGRLALVVHPALEDRAGNRFDRLFDRELGAPGLSGPEPFRMEFSTP